MGAATDNMENIVQLATSVADQQASILQTAPNRSVIEVVLALGGLSRYFSANLNGNGTPVKW